jgi:hypothetical protein
MFAGMFDQRCVEHSEEMESNTKLFLKNYRMLNKKVKTFGEIFFVLLLFAVGKIKFALLSEPSSCLKDCNIVCKELHVI